MRLTQAEAERRRLVRAGAYVAISVADTGGGIPPELIERVFEPFFSTKGERGGTGLGLSMVRWFAEQAGGVVELQSAVGQRYDGDLAVAATIRARKRRRRSDNAALDAAER